MAISERLSSNYLTLLFGWRHWKRYVSSFVPESKRISNSWSLPTYLSLSKLLASLWLIPVSQVLLLPPDSWLTLFNCYLFNSLRGHNTIKICHKKTLYIFLSENYMLIPTTRTEKHTSFFVNSTNMQQSI